MATSPHTACVAIFRWRFNRFRKCLSSGPAVVCALYKVLFSCCRRVQVPHASKCMGVQKRFSDQVIARTIDDSRSGMNFVAFRTAPPSGGLSCCIHYHSDTPPMRGGIPVTSSSSTDLDPRRRLSCPCLWRSAVRALDDRSRMRHGLMPRSHLLPMQSNFRVLLPPKARPV